MTTSHPIKNMKQKTTAHLPKSAGENWLLLR